LGLKVAMVSPWHVRCGISSYTENLVGALAEKGVDVYVVRLPRFGMLTDGILDSLARSIPADKVDLVHVQHEYGRYQNLEGGFYGALSKLGLPVVTTMHATGNFPVDSVVADASGKVIVHNEWCRRLFAYPDKVEVIPHGCKPIHPPQRAAARVYLDLPEKAPLVGYCGYISPTKGLEVLIDAVAEVEGVGLLVAGGWFTEGDTKYISQLKLKSSKLLPGRCKWLGWIPNDQMPTVYGAVDLVVYPSRFASESGALLTALSHGKAVVASPLPPFKEKEELGVLETFRDVGDLADRIRGLIGDAERRRRLEEAARRYAEASAWSKVAESHIELYRRLQVKV